MNCKKAKEISIISYLKKCGISPHKTTNNEVWFLSPFREEKTPSFKIDLDKNIWFDFGEGIGGTIIDLVMKSNNCSVKNALQILDQGTFSFHQQSKMLASQKSYSILKIAELTNKNLIDYLLRRKINIQYSKRFCFQVHYSFSTGKEYYGIGFMNDFGGLEIRNNFFKGCLGKKAITTINNNSDTISLFESWSDFLSYLTLKKVIPKENFIILNSTTLIKKIPELITDYKRIKCFFDNDGAGNRALKHLQNTSKKTIIDCRIYYKKYNDLNDYLTQRG